MQTVWVEMPATNIERARDFYQAVFEVEAEEIRKDEIRRTCTIFNTAAGNGVGLSLTQTDGFVPNTHATLVYYDASNKLDGILERVAEAGGKVTTPRTPMGDDGASFYAICADTEGNAFAFFAYEPKE